MNPKASIDWEEIEKEYLLGQKSIALIANLHHIAHTTILRRAKKLGWKRDKSSEVRSRTNAALLSIPQTHNDPVFTSAQENAQLPGKRTEPLSQDDIEIAVLTNVEVIRSHRRDIQKTLSIIAMLAEQLRQAAIDRPQIEEEITIDTADDKNGFRRAKMQKAVSLPGHAAVVRDLSTAIRNLVPLERQAFGIDADEQGRPVVSTKDFSNGEYLHE